MSLQKQSRHYMVQKKQLLCSTPLKRYLQLLRDKIGHSCSLNDGQLMGSKKNKLLYKTRAWLFKLMMSLVNVLLNFQKLISQICQYFLLKKCEKLLHCNAKASLIFSTKNFSVCGYKVVKYLTS